MAVFAPIEPQDPALMRPTKTSEVKMNKPSSTRRPGEPANRLIDDDTVVMSPGELKSILEAPQREDIIKFLVRVGFKREFIEEFSTDDLKFMAGY